MRFKKRETKLSIAIVYLKNQQTAFKHFVNEELELQIIYFSFRTSFSRIDKLSTLNFLLHRNFIDPIEKSKFLVHTQLLKMLANVHSDNKRKIKITSSECMIFVLHHLVTNT